MASNARMRNLGLIGSFHRCLSLKETCWKPPAEKLAYRVRESRKETGKLLTLDIDVWKSSKPRDVFEFVVGLSVFWTSFALPSMGYITKKTQEHEPKQLGSPMAAGNGDSTLTAQCSCTAGTQSPPFLIRSTVVIAKRQHSRVFSSTDDRQARTHQRRQSWPSSPSTSFPPLHLEEITSSKPSVPLASKQGSETRNPFQFKVCWQCSFRDDKYYSKMSIGKDLRMFLKGGLWNMGVYDQGNCRSSFMQLSKCRLDCDFAELFWVGRADRINHHFLPRRLWVCISVSQRRQGILFASSFHFCW